MTSIRQVHKDLTYERILEAAIELMAETLDSSVSLADIAARAGVTERTIYRHFQSRELLVEAVWPRVHARLQEQGYPHKAAHLIAETLRVFPKFDRSEGLVRASAFSESGRRINMQANADRHAAMLACVDDALPGLDERTRRHRAAIIQLIYSAYGWAVLKDFGGFDGHEAGEAAAEAIAVLLGLRSPAAKGSTAKGTKVKTK